MSDGKRCGIGAGVLAGPLEGRCLWPWLRAAERRPTSGTTGQTGLHQVTIWIQFRSWLRMKYN